MLRENCLLSIERQLPFLEIDSPALQRLLEYLDPRSVKALTTANNTLQVDCIRYFEIAKNTIINILSIARRNRLLSRLAIGQDWSWKAVSMVRFGLSLTLTQSKVSRFDRSGSVRG